MITSAGEKDVLCYKPFLIEVIKKFLPHCTVYLFGSRSLGTQRPYSDIDLAILDEHTISNDILDQIKDAIDRLNIPYCVDVVDLRNMSEDIKNHVRKYGIIWMEKTQV